MTRRLVRTKASALILRALPEIKPETDTGNRLIGGQNAIALGETFDKKWLFIDAPSGGGWSSAAYLEDVPDSFTVVTRWPRVPVGREGIISLFGEPCKPLCESGRVTLPSSLPLSWSPAQRVTRFACHELIAPVFESVFAEIFRRGYWELLEDFGGCYNCREQRGTTKKTSTHSWGIGIDLNTVQNPLGAKPKMPGTIIAIFKDHGFTWGGTWNRPDGMHFQYANGY